MTAVSAPLASVTESSSTSAAVGRADDPAQDTSPRGAHPSAVSAEQRHRLESSVVPSEALRRIAIDPVTRVEGHGKVTILIDEQHRVHQVRFHIVEFRGFEKFIEGRPYWEVPVAVQRLCGICPVSHHLAATKALEDALGITAPPTAQKLRRLMHYGQILQSHALHFFHLSSPDLLFGFDAPAAQRNIVGVLAQYPEIARQGVLLRKYGQEVIEAVAGKRIHGTGAIPGGVNQPLSTSKREALRAPLLDVLTWCEQAVGLVEEIFARQTEDLLAFGWFEAHAMSLVRADGALELYHGGLRARLSDGTVLFDHLDYRRYDEVISEVVKPWSYMKFPFWNALGDIEQGWYRVGPLARVTLCDFIPTPRAEAARQRFLAFADGAAARGATLAYHWARMIEMLHAAEMIDALLDDPEITGTDLVVGPGEQRGRGVGVIEAPRGTLIHDYTIGDNDLITRCNLIVSTTHNNQAMNEAIRAVALQHLDGNEITEGLLNHIEVAVRAFDPCLSCATHALGKMPLVVELRDALGALLAVQTRPASA